jgi:putative ABC transport system substrate-binding protein
MMAGRLLLVVVVMFALLVAPPVGSTQQPAKIPRIGMLNISAPEHPEGRMTVDVFRQALGERGYVEGRNIVIEYRWAEGKIERLPALAAELVRLKVDLIVAGATPQARAAKQATATIPIVAWSMQAPVHDGLVASLARPGGNVTGLTFLGPELVPKLLALLKETLPRVSRVAALWHPGGYAERTRQEMAKDAEDAVRRLGVNLQFVRADGPTDLDGAFSAMARERAEALIVFPSPMLYGERRRIVALEAKHRLPAMHNADEWAHLGGLMAYGASIPALVRRGVDYVDKILKGAKPADLPVEQPTKYELVINLKTAKALGLMIPQSVLTRADEIIN